MLIILQDHLKAEFVYFSFNLAQHDSETVSQICCKKRWR